MSWYFTETERQYLRDNYTTQTIYQMAKALGRGKSSVGYQLQTVLQLKIPAELYAKNKELKKEAAITRKAEKKLIACNKRKLIYFKKLVKKPHQKNPVKTKKEINWCKKTLKQPAIKIPDSSNLIAVRINHKTTLFIKPGADIQAIKRLYNF